MPIKNKNNKKKDIQIIELAKEIPTSVISVQREYILNVNIVNPKTMDELYSSVPEVSRAIDLRGSAVISRGYEITPRDDSEASKKYADIVSYILNKSGGVNFIEQWNKNTDLYGNGYVELVEDGSKIIELVHVHPYNFGYELEFYVDPVDFQEKSKIKLDKETQKPVGYATYKYDDQKNIYVNDKQIPIENIAHLKYKVIGDALYGISLIQPMYGSIIRKLKIEDSIESAARLVSSPKMVISGEFGSDEEARDEAKEAASLDVNDVIILQNGKTFDFVNPGQTNLPALREIFVVNITTASGIPRPILTSESSEINKATMQELMTQLRENMRSNMNKMKNILEYKIFARIGESYKIKNFESIIPVISFPEDVESEQEIIVREEKKAATLTSLSNSFQILNNVLLASGSDTEIQNTIKEMLQKTASIYNKTVDTFSVNDDQELGKIEEVIPKDVGTNKKSLKLNYGYVSIDEEVKAIPIESTVEEGSTYTQITLIDDVYDLKNPLRLLDRHSLMHDLYDALQKGAEIWDIETGSIISIESIVKKHIQYILAMNELGMVHEPSEIASELDSISENQSLSEW